MKTIKTHMTFCSDAFLLKGVLHLPEQKAPPVVIGSHGLEGSKESAKQKVLSRLLPDHGIAFFRFDHRGCGESQGDFLTQTSLEKRAQDVLSAVETIMASGLTGNRIALFGSSLGGAACIKAWEFVQKMELKLCGAVICSAPVQSRTIENIPVDPTEKRDALPLCFFKDNLVFNILEQSRCLKNVLIFHGDHDEVVPVQNAHNIYARAQAPKKLIIQKNGDHQMSSEKDRKEFEQESLKWFMSCFGFDPLV